MMIAALYSNEGLNDDKGTRQRAIEDLEAQYNEAVMALTGQIDIEEEEIDYSNPFWGSMKKGMEKIHGSKTYVEPDATVKQVASEEEDFSRYIDQA